MYSREKRMKAIELYIKYGKSTADVIRELGYPDCIRRVKLNTLTVFCKPKIPTFAK